MPPGVDHAFFSPGDRAGARAALGLDDRPTLLFVGRIQPLKGLTVAVEALALMQRTDTRLVVVGGASGPDGAAELERVRSQVSGLGLTDRVAFVEPQPHHALSTWYRSADAVLMPSRSESFGLVALEAAACGVPVVASSVGGLRTLVVDGRTGFLVDHRDPGAKAAKIDQLLADPELAAAMGTGAAEHAANYSWAGTAGRLRRLYSDLSKASLVQWREPPGGSTPSPTDLLHRRSSWGSRRSSPGGSRHNLRRTPRSRPRNVTPSVTPAAGWWASRVTSSPPSRFGSRSASAASTPRPTLPPHPWSRLQRPRSTCCARCAGSVACRRG
ncbi:MAG: glycosyltransferase [Microthrixaceae bacterium]|nr:glycosyltransferase [Microthrixaceae bacterium]